MDKQTRNFFLFFSAVMCLIVALEIINQRFWLNDFRVYYDAAGAYLRHEQVYQRPFGEDTGLFKYAPIVLWLFAPATVLPYFVACVIHCVLVVFAYVLALRLAFRLATGVSPILENKKALVFLLSFVFTLNHLFREVHLGNVNVILVALLLMAFHLQSVGRLGFSAFLFMMAVFMKPYLIVLCVPFLFAKQIKLIVRAAAIGLACLLLFLVANGTAAFSNLHQEWIIGMQNHSEFLVSTNTITALLQQMSITVSTPIADAFLLGVFALVVWWRKASTSVWLNKSEVYLMFIALLALIPCLVITDTEHFLFALPLIVFALMRVLQQGKPAGLVFIVLALLCYGANLGDVLGSALSDQLEHAGFLGLGNLAIIFFSISNRSFYAGEEVASEQ